jgi:hypothetical protein
VARARHHAAIICGRRLRSVAERPPCRWPGCSRCASQSGWGCRAHWFLLPPDLRARLWRVAQREIGANGRLGPAWECVAEEADRFAIEKAAAPPRRDRHQPELPL